MWYIAAYLDSYCKATYFLHHLLFVASIHYKKTVDKFVFGNNVEGKGGKGLAKIKMRWKLDELKFILGKMCRNTVNPWPADKS